MSSLSIIIDFINITLFWKSALLDFLFLFLRLFFIVKFFIISLIYQFLHLNKLLLLVNNIISYLINLFFCLFFLIFRLFYHIIQIFDPLVSYRNIIVEIFQLIFQFINGINIFWFTRKYHLTLINSKILIDIIWISDSFTFLLINLLCST